MATKNSTKVSSANVKMPVSSNLDFAKTFYLSLATLMGLVIFVIGIIGGIRVLMTNVIFNVDDTYYYYSPYDISPCEQPKPVYYNLQPGELPPMRTSEEVKDCEQKMEEGKVKQKDMNFKRDVAWSSAMVLVGLPVWLFHWIILRSEKKKKNQNA
jgi:hypothetical protein